MNTHDIFDFLSKKVGGRGHFLCGPHRAEKWGGDASPRPPPIYVHDLTSESILTVLPNQLVHDIKLLSMYQTSSFALGSCSVACLCSCYGVAGQKSNCHS